MMHSARGFGAISAHRGGALAAARGVTALVLAWGCLAAQAQKPVPELAASAAANGVTLKWTPIPAPDDRLRRQQVGVVINEDDPYSVAVGEYYIRQRQLGPHQVLRLRMPLRAKLTPQEFQPIRQLIQSHFGDEIQALALAWRRPWAVGCNAITAAVTLGYDVMKCAGTCDRTLSSPLYNHPTSTPLATLGLRPSMLLAASDEAAAFQMIERGVVSDGSLALPVGPAVSAVFQITKDTPRNSRVPLFPPPSRLNRRVTVAVEQADHVPAPRPASERLFLFETGASTLPNMASYRFVPGAVADHLTSAGGILDGNSGQMSALEWISAGATATYGAVSEPCNFPEKFPHPQIVLQNLLAGSTVLEAYWRSVAWPGQGLFVGEPLAAPFAVVRPARGAASGRPDAPPVPQEPVSAAGS